MLSNCLGSLKSRTYRLCLEFFWPVRIQGGKCIRNVICHASYPPCRSAGTKHWQEHRDKSGPLLANLTCKVCVAVKIEWSETKIWNAEIVWSLVANRCNVVTAVVAAAMNGAWCFLFWHSSRTSKGSGLLWNNGLHVLNCTMQSQIELWQIDFTVPLK